MNFLITTHHNKDTRWQYIKQHLEYEGIEYMPILAPDYNLFRHTQLTESQWKHQSLTLAYYQIAQTAVFMDLAEYIVLEDDVQVAPNWMFGEPQEEFFHLAYLTRTNHNQYAQTEPCILDDNYLLIKNNWWETPATLWTLTFAKDFIKWIEHKLTEGLWLGHIDHELNKMNQTGKFVFLGCKHQTAVGLSSDRSKANGLISFEGSISPDA